VIVPNVANRSLHIRSIEIIWPEDNTGKAGLKRKRHSEFQNRKQPKYSRWWLRNVATPHYMYVWQNKIQISGQCHISTMCFGSKSHLSPRAATWTSVLNLLLFQHGILANKNSYNQRIELGFRIPCNEERPADWERLNTTALPNYFRCCTCSVLCLKVIRMTGMKTSSLSNPRFTDTHKEFPVKKYISRFADAMQSDQIIENKFVALAMPRLWKILFNDGTDRAIIVCRNKSLILNGLWMWLIVDLISIRVMPILHMVTHSYTEGKSITTNSFFLSTCICICIYLCIRKTYLLTLVSLLWKTAKVQFREVEVCTEC